MDWFIELKRQTLSELTDNENKEQIIKGLDMLRNDYISAFELNQITEKETDKLLILNATLQRIVRIVNDETISNLCIYEN